MFNYTLTDSLITVTIIYSYSKTYSILKTILLSTSENKLSSDIIINYILVEEKSQSFQSTSQTVFFAHFGKRKEKIQDKKKDEQEKEANTKSKSGKYVYYKKKGYCKAECKKIKYDLEKKSAKILVKVARVE